MSETRDSWPQLDQEGAGYQESDEDGSSQVEKNRGPVIDLDELEPETQEEEQFLASLKERQSSSESEKEDGENKGGPNEIDLTEYEPETPEEEQFLSALLQARKSNEEDSREQED